MKVVPSPPVVSAAITGFVLGVLVTLVLNGAFKSHVNSATPTSTPVPTSTIPSAQLTQRLQRIVSRQLGASTIAHRNRLMRLWLGPTNEIPSRIPGFADYRTVNIVFELNNNPLGPSWRVRSAKADVFSVLKALYTSALPVYNVELTGHYFPNSASSFQLTHALVAFMSESESLRIPWQKWGREHEGAVWTALPYKYVNPRFG